jgi:hypothetical protein
VRRHACGVCVAASAKYLKPQALADAINTFGIAESGGRLRFFDLVCVWAPTLCIHALTLCAQAPMLCVRPFSAGQTCVRTAASDIGRHGRNGR